MQAVTLTPDKVHELATTHKVVLINIRTPDEWAATGSGAGTHRVDTRRNNFVSALDASTSGERSTPVAPICAKNVRSDRTSRRL
jgi:rhodanese-related sulfurtransferase